MFKHLLFFYGPSRFICLTWHLNRGRTPSCFQKSANHQQVVLCQLYQLKNFDCGLRGVVEYRIYRGWFLNVWLFRRSTEWKDNQWRRQWNSLANQPYSLCRKQDLLKVIVFLSCHWFVFCFLNTQTDYLNAWTFELCFFYSLGFSSTELPPHLEKIKQQANDAFAQQQWTRAIQLYSLGIHQANCNAMLYGNRAAAYMKRKWYVLLCGKIIHQLLEGYKRSYQVFVYTCDSQGWRPLRCPQGLSEGSDSKPWTSESSF